MEMALRATDGEDDNQLVIVKEDEAKKIKNNVFEFSDGSQYGEIKERLIKESGIIPNEKMANKENGVIKVDATNEIAGDVYNLDDESDLNKLTKTTDMTNMEPKGDNSMIIFQNGMSTDAKKVKEGILKLAEVTGKEVDEIGMMHNNTDGLGGDLMEYGAEGIRTKDVVNAKYLEKLSKNGEKNLIVAHSAGNKDVKKAMDVLALEGKQIENVDVMSVGSPVGEKELKKSASKVGVNIVGQYNNKLDPITHPKTWVAGTAVSAATLGVAGAAFGVSMVGVGASQMAGYGAGLVGGGMILTNLAVQHPFNAYVDKNYNGLVDDIQQWQKNHDQ